jgi:hypothetical protein
VVCERGGSCVADTRGVGAAIMVHVELLVHVVGSVVGGEEGGRGVVGHVVVRGVRCRAVEALVPRLAFTLVRMNAVRFQLAVGRIAGSISHSILR